MNPDQMDREIKGILSQKKEKMPAEVADEIQHTLDNLPKRKSLKDKLTNRFFMRRGIGFTVLALLLIFVAGFASQHFFTLVNDQGEEIFRIEEFKGEKMEADFLDITKEVQNRMELGEVKHVYIDDPNDDQKPYMTTITKPKHYGSLMQLKSHVDFSVRTPSYLPDGYDYTYGTMTKGFDVKETKLKERFDQVSEHKQKELIVIDGMVEGTPDGVHLNYENANDEVITTRQWHDGPSKMYVAELNDRQGSKLRIHGMDAIHRETDSYQVILWKDGISLFEVYTTVTSLKKEELIKIAKSMYTE